MLFSDDGCGRIQLTVGNATSRQGILGPIRKQAEQAIRRNLIINITMASVPVRSPRFLCWLSLVMALQVV